MIIIVIAIVWIPIINTQLAYQYTTLVSGYPFKNDIPKGVKENLGF